MGEREQLRSRPGHYWDLREARWLPSPSTVVEGMIPAQPEAVDRVEDPAQ
jgi:hypothetical protein